MSDSDTPKSEFVRWLVCGATAGLAVDLSLYPLDTLKTRLQSEVGFRAAGGCRNLYRGMSSVAIGSAPGAALFFTSYSSIKKVIGSDSPLTNAIGASIAETVACLVRVPTELIKQRAQANAGRSIASIAGLIYRNDGLSGFYRGYVSTVAREIPFSLIEFPLWEYLKIKVAHHQQRECLPIESAACGSVAGCVAAGLTTPLDVVKTRTMLNEGSQKLSTMATLRLVHSQGGINALYAGVWPRMSWMALGGFVFFGAYETACALTNNF
uniref:S-adenosylmethionine mitochondrial carrier protein n=1 Tax=Steinernema glaseri TaxID=37863 RepID=A0A1I8AKW4_9BILA